MAIENSITFGGVNSADFGIYISGEGVFNAPERDVEMIEIPGRNGELALDKGRFKNIEVTYPAFNYEEDYDTFVQNLSDFRNAICSQIGYQRLSDTFHEDEYRMATFIGGLEIDPIKYNTASRFDIVFNCKPQRWLTSGEDAISVDSGDVISNPTLFEASPLVAVEGEGNFAINDYEITVNGNEPIGTIQLASGGYISRYDPIRFSTDALNTGDEIYVADAYVDFFMRDDAGATVTSYTKTTSGYSGTTIEDSIVDGQIRGRISYGLETFNLGTARNITTTVTHHVTFSNSHTADFKTQVIYKYAGADTIELYVNTTLTPSSAALDLREGTGGKYGNVTAYSTIFSGGTTILDCEIGEAYKYDDGTLIPLNSFVSFGSDLPTLKPGANTITFDNTITDLKVTPRWWRI